MDLVIRRAVTVPLRPTAGRPFVFRVTVKNLGSAPARMRSHVLGSPDCPALRLSAPLILSGGVERTFTLTAPRSMRVQGTRRCTFEVDPGGQVQEKNEGNNRRICTYSVRPAPAPGTSAPPSGSASSVPIASIGLVVPSVGGGGSVRANVSLASLAPAGGAKVSLASNKPNVATTPVAVTVPAGRSAVEFQVTTQAVSTPTNVTLSASSGGATRTATLAVTPPKLTAIGYSYTSGVAGFLGQTSTPLGVVIDGPAPPGGAAVTIQSSSPKVTVPASILIAAGQTQAFSTMSIGAVTQTTQVTITASYGGVTKSGTFDIIPALPALSVTGISPTSGPPGSMITITGTGLTKQVKVGNLYLAYIGAVSSNQVKVQVGGASIPGTYAVTVSNGAGATATSPTAFTVLAPGQASAPPPPSSGLASLGVLNENIGSGGSTRANVSLANLAPAGGTTVTLSSGAPSVASVPATVTIPAGQSAVEFKVTAGEVSAPSTVTLSASAGGVTRTTTLTITPPKLTAIGYGYAQGVQGFYGGTATSLGVVIDGPAPSGGAAVAIQSSNPALLVVPATVTVAAGKTQGFGTMSFGAVTQATQVTLTASYGGVTKTGTFSIAPLPPPPVITSISPTSGPGGTMITINGSNLTNQIKVGSLYLAYVGMASSTQVKVQVGGASIPGVYVVSVTNAAGTATSPTGFTVTPK